MSGKRNIRIHIDPDTDYWQEDKLYPVMVSQYTLDELVLGRKVKYLEEGKDFDFVDEGEDELERAERLGDAGPQDESYSGWLPINPEEDE